MSTVPSPCNDVCVFDQEREMCTGCWRTMDEIGSWSRMDDQQRRAVYAAIEKRRAAEERSGKRSNAA